MGLDYAIEMSQEEYQRIKERLGSFDSDKEFGIGIRYQPGAKIMSTIVKESRLLVLTQDDMNTLDNDARRKVNLILNYTKRQLEEMRLREAHWIE